MDRSMIESMVQTASAHVVDRDLELSCDFVARLSFLI